MRTMVLLSGVTLLTLASPGPVARVQDPAAPIQYRVLATTKTSTMEKELNAVADLGFRFATVMGGETAVGGKEVVVIASRTGGAAPRYEYKLLATNKTSTMQKELQEAADGGYEYRGQTVFESLFGGKEVVCILERDRDNRTPVVYKYLLLATTRTSTMEKELKQAGEEGYQALGMTVGKTALGGTELVTIMRRPVR
jgi:hypothetical protein